MFSLIWYVFQIYVKVFAPSWACFPLFGPMDLKEFLCQCVSLFWGQIPRRHASMRWTQSADRQTHLKLIQLQIGSHFAQRQSSSSLYPPPSVRIPEAAWPWPAPAWPSRSHLSSCSRATHGHFSAQLHRLLHSTQQLVYRPLSTVQGWV